MPTGRQKKQSTSSIILKRRDVDFYRQCLEKTWVFVKFMQSFWGILGCGRAWNPPVPYRAKYLSLLKLGCPVVEESELEACANGCKKRRSWCIRQGKILKRRLVLDGSGRFLSISLLKPLFLVQPSDAKLRRKGQCSNLAFEARYAAEADKAGLRGTLQREELGMHGECYDVVQVWCESWFKVQSLPNRNGFWFGK